MATKRQYKKIFKNVIPAEMKQSANDNYIQQIPLPLVHSNDNNSGETKKRKIRYSSFFDSF